MPDSLDIKTELAGASISVTFADGRLTEDVKITNPLSYGFHSHAGFEVLYILKNHVRMIGNERVELKQGDFLVIKPLVRHRISADEKTHSCLGFMMVITFGNQESGEAHPLLSLFAGPKSYFMIPDEDGQLCSNLMRIQTEMTEKRPGWDTVVNSEFSCFIIRLARRIRYEMIDQSKGFMRIKDVDLARKIGEYIDYHYFSNVTRKDMADHFYLSVYQLDRLLLNLYNKSFRRLVLERRMEAARLYTEDTQLPFHEISEKLGYDSLSSFFISYKKYYGKTPGTMRKQSCRRD